MTLLIALVLEHEANSKSELNMSVQPFIQSRCLPLHLAPFSYHLAQSS